ncbi:MAG TPA: prephenate dehydratase [Bacteroidales bacterium]|nr:prephenate dehydratase [Bacteroidales bacterium]
MYIDPAEQAGFFVFIPTMLRDNRKDYESKKVAIQGIKGSFHEVAACRYFSQCQLDIIECETFEEIISSLCNRKADYGVMAIENTVAGTILRNYELLRDNPVRIIGEEYLRIKQNLLCFPGQQLKDISEVHSHHMAISQCREFFKQYPSIKLVESVDTAQSAKEIRLNNLKGFGAIAGEMAAEMYQLEVLASGIETNKRNYTRFLILVNSEKNKNNIDNADTSSQTNKASLCFSLPHSKGSLAEVLTILANNEMNLTKIQSLPIIGKEFQYFFIVDVTFDNYSHYQKGLTEISKKVIDLQILGEYAHSIESLENIHN